MRKLLKRDAFHYVLMFVFSIILFASCSVTTVVIRNSNDIDRNFRKNNVTFRIQSDLDMHGKIIRLGEGCTLDFDGGSLYNCIIEGCNTKVKQTRNNVFHNSEIRGSWCMNASFSDMFDTDMDASLLLKNLSCLSKNIVLSANRDYNIAGHNLELEIESLSSLNNDKPLIGFHTLDPNAEGLRLVGNNVIIKGIQFSDDFDAKEDSNNDVTIGNMIAVRARNNTVQSLLVEKCDFMGSTSSSFIASSQVLKCVVRDCSFTGYMGDHAIYCSTNIESFLISDCYISDITHTRGLFKVRGSNRLKEYTVKDIKVHNLNGYLSNVALKETPNCDILFEKIWINKDNKSNDVFYGFCITDDMGISEGSYNANNITIRDCKFEYGYNGNPIIYSGAGKAVRVKTVNFINTFAAHSNFAGGCADAISVRNSEFIECCNRIGIVPEANEINIINTRLVKKQGEFPKSLFLLNYDTDNVRTINMENVDIDADVINVFDVNKGDTMAVRMRKCSIKSFKNHVISVPATTNIKLRELNNKISIREGYEILGNK